MKTSGIFKLVTKDWLKGLIVAILGAIFAVIQPLISTGTLTFDWKYIGTVALGAGLAYITKNFLTNNKDQLLTKDVPKP